MQQPGKHRAAEIPGWLQLSRAESAHPANTIEREVYKKQARQTAATARRRQQAAGRGSQSAGRSSAFAISALLTTLVLMPLPRPSICRAGVQAERR